MVSESDRRARARRWLWVIVLLGFLLRLTAWKWGQAYAYFGQNDAIEAYSVAVKYWNGDERAHYIGQPNCNPKSKLPGPLWTLFCYWPLRLTGSMQGVMAAMTLLNTAAILLIYLLAESALGAVAALWAASLFAVLPTALFYSADVYNPNVMPFVGAVMGLALWRTIERDNSRWIALVCSLFIIMPQFHMSGLMLAPAILVVLWLAGARLSIPWLLGGTAVGLACYIPYVRGELANNWHNTRGIFSGGHGHSWDSLKTIIAPFTLLVNWVPQWTRTFGEYRALGHSCLGSFWALAAFNLISAVSALTLIGLVGMRVVQALQGFLDAPRQVFARHKGLLFMATLFLTPLICTLLTRQPFHARYGLVLLPSLACLAGFAIAEMFVRSSQLTSPARNQNEPEHLKHSQPIIPVLFPAGLRSLRTSRPLFYRLGLATTLITVAFNALFMPAMFFHRGRMIDQNTAFVPSFRNIDRVYAVLQQHAGVGHPVLVDAKPFLSTLVPGDEVHAGPLLFAAYVAIRQQEPPSRRTCKHRPVVYQLLTADQAQSDDPRVVYRGHGFVLVKS